MENVIHIIQLANWIHFYLLTQKPSSQNGNSLFPTQSLAKDLSEAEEQYAHALRSHLHNIDQLLALQRCRLSLLEESYNRELEALTKEFETERYGGLIPGQYPECL